MTVDMVCTISRPFERPPKILNCTVASSTDNQVLDMYEQSITLTFLWFLLLHVFICTFATMQRDKSNSIRDKCYLKFKFIYLVYLLIDFDANFLIPLSM